MHHAVVFTLDLGTLFFALMHSNFGMLIVHSIGERHPCSFGSAHNLSLELIFLQKTDVRNLEDSQFISILKWKKKTFQYFGIKEGKGGYSQWRQRSFFKSKGNIGLCLKGLKNLALSSDNKRSLETRHFKTL